MFSVSACEEFESWYEALPEAEAELVSSAIDVLAELGPALGPPRSSELLLWFDGVPPRQSLDELDDFQGFLKMAAIGQPLDIRRLRAQSGHYWELLGWKRRSLSLFDSERFRSRLAVLEPKAAASALRGVEQVRQALGRAKLQLVLMGKILEPSLQGIDEAIDGILCAAGLRLSDPDLHDAGLRELRVELVQRLCRVIYGIDPGKKRVLLMVGEPLDRAYYGDAVRVAERRWGDYLASEYLTLLEAER
jgi:hypothetical protein